MNEPIDHAAVARETIGEMKFPESNAGLVAHAQVHALLALVEQQRIANLIALATPQTLFDGGKASLPSWDAQYQLRADIRTGLGL